MKKHPTFSELSKVNYAAVVKETHFVLIHLKLSHLKGSGKKSKGKM